jgi:hypothetical protein
VRTLHGNLRPHRAVLMQQEKFFYCRIFSKENTICHYMIEFSTEILIRQSPWTGEELAELKASRTCCLHWWNFADWAVEKGSEARNGWLVLYMVCSTHYSLAVWFWCPYICVCSTHIIVGPMNSYHSQSHFDVSGINPPEYLITPPPSWRANLLNRILEYFHIIYFIQLTRLDSLHVHKMWWC